MMRIPLLAGLAGSVLAAATLAASKVDVVFTDPDSFADAGPRVDREVTLRDLRHLLESLASRRLADGDMLTIEVLDVDLAGRMEPTPSGRRDVRTMRDIDAPRMTVRYTLTRAGQRSSGTEHLTDLSYLRDSKRCRTSEPLCHESRMLDAWLSRLLNEAQAKQQGRRMQ